MAILKVEKVIPKINLENTNKSLILNYAPIEF